MGQGSPSHVTFQPWIGGVNHDTHMKTASADCVGLLLAVAMPAAAHSETAVGALFGYPGNVGLSVRFDNTPIGVAWSEDFIHGTIDSWFIKRDLGNGDKLDWYFGPGLDMGIPLD